MKQDSSREPAGQHGRPKNDDLIFIRLRRRLESIARRMLGSTAEAEDVVQDVWLRWHAAAEHNIENAEAWLVSVTKRLSIDRLRTIRIHSQHGAQRGMPMLAFTEWTASPQEMNEYADEVSAAYLTLLERLTHEARAAFLMHEVFDADYEQIGTALHKTPVACRKLVSRAKEQLREGRAQVSVSPQIHHHLLEIFVRVLAQGDLTEIIVLMGREAAMIEARHPAAPPRLFSAAALPMLARTPANQHTSDLGAYR